MSFMSVILFQSKRSKFFVNTPAPSQESCNQVFLVLGSRNQLNVRCLVLNINMKIF